MFVMAQPGIILESIGMPVFFAKSAKKGQKMLKRLGKGKIFENWAKMYKI